MRFSCSKENLLKALGVAERFTGKNVTLPILSNILLEVKEKLIFITATNLEYAVQVLFPGKSTESGRVSIPAKILSSLIQSVKEEEVELEAKQENLFLSTKSLNTRINGMPADDFPLLPLIKKTASVSLETSPLKSGLEKILPAVSNSEFKPELMGVFFRVTPKTIYCAATDTFRLAEKTIPYEGKPAESFSFILPHRAALELARILPDGEEITISIGDNQVLFETEDVKLISRLIEGNFPEYSGIIPKNFETTCYVEKNELLAAVRSSSIFASKIQEVTLTFGKNSLEISSTNPEVGEHSVTLPIPHTGKELSISFNYRYLLDAISGIEEKELFLGVNGEQAPSLLRNKNDGTFLYVLMPIRLT